MANISSVDALWAALPPELDDDATDGAPSVLDRDHDFIKLRDDFNKKRAQASASDVYFDWDLDDDVVVIR